MYRTQTGGGFGNGEKNLLLQRIGSVMMGLDTIHDLNLQQAEDGQNDFIEARILESREEILDSLESFPDLKFFEILDLTCSNDTFFEALAMCIKNEALKRQHKIYILKNAKKARL